MAVGRNDGKKKCLFPCHDALHTIEYSPLCQRKKSSIVIAHNIRSTYNVGSFFRTADCLGVDELILSGYTACPPHKGIVKVSLGAEMTVPWRYYRTIGQVIRFLKQERYHLYALELVPGAIPLGQFCPRFPAALIVGNEVKGVDRRIWQQCEKVISIPLRGQKESLNVVSAMAIAAWALINK